MTRTSITSGDRTAITSGDRTGVSASDVTGVSPEDVHPWYFPAPPVLYLDAERDDTLPAEGNGDGSPKTLVSDSDDAASQGTASAQPTVGSDANGAYWDFDGSDDYWAVSKYDATPAQTTVAWVSRGTSGRNDRIFTQVNSTGNAEMLLWIAATTDKPSAIVTDNAGSTSSFVSPTTDGTQTHAGVFRIDWKADTLKVWADDGSGIAKDNDMSTALADDQMPATTDKNIGRRPVGPSFYDGSLYSIIEWPTFLTDSQTTTLMKELVADWGIT